MSWSLYFTARNEASAREYVKQQKVQSQETPYAMPQAAKDLILATIDLAGIGMQTPDLGVKCEASGHTPGSAKVSIVAESIV
jgi:hypothetical protein